MRVSAKAEYACVAMIELARSFGETQPVRVTAIADAHGIPQRFLVQILLQLKGAGLVSSVRGASGGYQLARAPKTISLATIIQVIDSALPARTTALIADSSPAVRAVRSVWKDIQSEEQRILEECTLAELLRRLQSVSAYSYQI